MNDPNPLVSVVVPTYNRAATISKTLESVYAQDYSPIEVIVVDDASSDETESVLLPYIKKGLRYLRLPSNGGAPAARNAGIYTAKGSFIAFLDSDDAWTAEKLTKQMAVMLRGGDSLGLVYVGMKKVDEKGTVLGYKIPSCRGKIYQVLLNENVVGSTSTGLVKTEALKAVGGFDVTLRSRQDLDLWLRLSQLYDVDFVPEPLVQYLIHDNRISVNNDAKIQGAESILNKYHSDISRFPKTLASHLYNLGRLYQRKGDKTSARRKYRDALDAYFTLKSFLRYLSSFL